MVKKSFIWCKRRQSKWFEKLNFSEQFSKLINHYKRIGYSLDIMWQTAHLVINPIIIDGYPASKKYRTYMGPKWWNYTNDYVPVHLMDCKVPNERGLCTRASYCTFVQSRCLKDIGVFFNSWKWWLHAYLYIPLNFKSNTDIQVKIKTWPWIDVHVGKIVKINWIDTFIL